jgi:predicted nuclease of predicted toxin-antitoxin system
MKLLLDEHHSPRIASELAKAGFDVVSANGDERCRGASDEDLLAMATSERRAVVTENIGDFMALAARWSSDGRPHAGIILTHPARFNRALRSYPGTLVKALKAFLQDSPPTGGSWIWWL